MDIGFFFEYDGEVVQLPVNPAKIEVSFSGNNKTYEIIKLGEINKLKPRKLSDISFESWFPGTTWFPGIRTLGRFRGPSYYVDFFTKILNEGKYCRFVITGLTPAINTLVSIEKFDYDHRAGEEIDMYYSLELKEYKEFSAVEIQVTDSLKRNTSGTKTTSNKPATSTTKSNKVLKPAKITKGCTVILNGTVHYDSYGAKPGKTFKNYKGKVNFINMKGTHPYHVTTPSGGWLGWVREGDIKLA